MSSGPDVGIELEKLEIAGVAHLTISRGVLKIEIDACLDGVLQRMVRMISEFSAGFGMAESMDSAAR
jgi:hypothetical protein